MFFACWGSDLSGRVATWRAPLFFFFFTERSSVNSKSQLASMTGVWKQRHWEAWQEFVWKDFESMECYFVYTSVLWAVKPRISRKREEKLGDRCLNLHGLQGKRYFIQSCEIDSISWCHFLVCFSWNLRPIEVFLSPFTEAYYKYNCSLSFPNSLI